MDGKHRPGEKCHHFSGLGPVRPRPGQVRGRIRRRSRPEYASGCPGQPDCRCPLPGRPAARPGARASAAGSKWTVTERKAGTYSTTSGKRPLPAAVSSARQKLQHPPVDGRFDGIAELDGPIAVAEGKQAWGRWATAVIGELSPQGCSRSLRAMRTRPGQPSKAAVPQQQALAWAASQAAAKASPMILSRRALISPGPEVGADVLHPLRVTDGDAAGVGEHVGNDQDATLLEDEVGPWSD